MGSLRGISEELGDKINSSSPKNGRSETGFCRSGYYLFYSIIYKEIAT